jgi:hypothetical protein
VSSHEILQYSEISLILFNHFRIDDDEDEYQSPFASDLAMMDSEDMNSGEYELGVGPENMMKNQKWTRADLPEIIPSRDAVIFQQIDIDHYNGKPMPGMPGCQVS